MSNTVETKIPWIGLIPSEWEVAPLFSVASENKLKNHERNENVLSLSYGKIIRRDISKNFGLIPENFDSYQVVDKGYIIIRSTDLQNDKKSLRVGLVGEHGVITSAYIGLSPTEQIRPDYLFYYLYMCDLKKVFYSLGGGLRQSLRFEEFRRFPVVRPRLEEQKLISSYLDKKTSLIDSLINKIEKKIELLKEQRTSLINRFVTKGLDPNVEMKDSGVEWIGKIPKHWSVIKLKYFSEIKTGRDPSSSYIEEGQFDVLGTGGVIGKTNTPMYEHTSLILGRKGTIDKPFIQTRPFWISDVVYYTVTKGFIDSNYLWFLFTQIDFKYYKYGSTLPSMSSEEYENMKFPLPPENEVRSIQARLNEIDSRINCLISSLEKKTSLLKEYRQSLISFVVTGKLRVTEDMV